MIKIELGIPYIGFEKAHQKDKEENNYYTSKHVGNKEKSDKTCDYCGGVIKKGTPHITHRFYPEFYARATHEECSKLYEKFFNNK